MQRNLLVILVILILAINVIVFGSIYQGSLAPEDSSASTALKTVLSLKSPSSVEGAVEDTKIVLAVKLQNTSGISNGKLIFDYDNQVLAGKSVTSSKLVSVINQEVDNATGTISVDISSLDLDDLPANQELFTLTFLLTDPTLSYTLVSTSSESTLGSPNQLTISGFGNLQLNFIPSKCGDGIIESPNEDGVNEECDDGTSNGSLCNAAYGKTCQYCTADCTIKVVAGAVCGDGTQQTSEQCDVGARNGIACTPGYGTTCSYCNNNCQTTVIQGPKCGDGIVQNSIGEKCDSGAVNGVACAPADGVSCNYCNKDCQVVTVE